MCFISLENNIYFICSSVVVTSEELPVKEKS
jgi:hypothetical protein